MQKYFIHLQNQEGPFTFEELKAKGLKRDTPVWFDGLPDWQRAADVEELRNLFGAAPPPFAPIERKPVPKQAPVEHKVAAEKNMFAERLETYHPKWEKKRVYWLWVLGIVSLIIIAGVIIIPKLQQEDSKQQFRINPEQYIKVNHNGFKYNNVLGGIWDLKLTVVNKSGFAVDNVRCLVSYIRKNGETYKEEFVESGYIPAHGNVVVDAPNSSAGMDVNVRVYKVNSSEAGVY